MSKSYTSKDGIEVTVSDSNEDTKPSEKINMSKESDKTNTSNDSSTASSQNNNLSQHDDNSQNMVTKIMGGIALVLVGGTFGYFMNNQKANIPVASQTPTVSTSPVIENPVVKAPEITPPAIPTPAPVTNNQTNSMTYITILQEKAKQGDAIALARLGVLYLQGKDVPKNKALALEYLGQSAQKNNDTAQYYLGVLNLQDKKYAEGIQLLESAQKNGNPEASKFLAKIFDQKLQSQQNGISQEAHETLAKNNYHESKPAIVHHKSHTNHKKGDEFSHIDRELDKEFKHFEKNLDKEFGKIDKEFKGF